VLTLGEAKAEEPAALELKPVSVLEGDWQPAFVKIEETQ
jgi:hypothetical protein